jgi:hypothetical protein
MGGGKFFTERRYKASLRSDHPQGARAAGTPASAYACEEEDAGGTHR